MLQTIKGKLYKAFIPAKSFARRERSFWQNRNPENEDMHLQEYWDQRFDSPNRKILVNIISERLKKATQRQVSILEFGSYCGPNIDLIIRANPDLDLKIFAVEPNKFACKFLQKELPAIQIFNINDVEFVNGELITQQIDITFVNAVFYVVDQEHTKATITKMAKFSRTIVIGDELDNVDGKESQFSRKTLVFHHPYRTWLRELGYTKFELFKAPNPARAINGILVATKI
ncbi:MAG: hypothetical protein EOO45_00080 [Flavobacterium sp.]|nr:MAG: hypothetical protein EOO45_00080 [Flavobacterium sp.]